MKRYVAELVGTFVLVFGGCGSAVLAGDKIGFAGVSFAFGLSLLAMVYAIGPISGCHINPAVTVGVLLSKKMQPRYALGYLVAQVIGAMLAGLLLTSIMGIGMYLVTEFIERRTTGWATRGADAMTGPRR